ncbi:hypothetical protein ACEPAI_8438 [Sanghuangporus weigelae]
MSSVLSWEEAFLLRLLALLWLADFLAKKLLCFCHVSLYPRRGSSPQQASPQWKAYHAPVYAILALIFLSFNFIVLAQNIPSHFFQVLGVPDLDEAKLESAYRALTERYRLENTRPETVPKQVAIQRAYECLKELLKDSNKRFSYQLFGPDVFGWRDCHVMVDYLRIGMQNSFKFYILILAILLLRSLVKRSKPALWDYGLLLCTFACELWLLLDPRLPMPLASLFPGHLPYQNILLLRALFASLTAALICLVPMLFPEEVKIHPDLVEIEVRVKHRGEEVRRCIHLDLPAMDKRSTEQTRIDEMEEELVEKHLLSGRGQAKPQDGDAC